MSLGLLLALVSVACGPASPTEPAPSAPAPTARASAAASPSPGVVAVRVFLHDRARLDDPEDVQPVSRTVTVTDQRVLAAALESLAAGATPEEATRGLFSQVQMLLRGPSTCGGPTFQVAIDSAGRTTVRLCRRTESPGVLADARFITEIRATAQQFPTVQAVRILTFDGHCFGDESGRDLCLRD